MSFKLPFGWSLDPHPFARGGSACIVLTSLMHLTQAVMLAFSVAAGGGTGIDRLMRLFDYDRAVLVPTMLIFACFALIAAACRVGYVRLLLLVPQQSLLSVMAFGALAAVFNQQYGDGVPRGWPFILGDQFPLIVLFLVHGSAILRRARDPNG